MKDEDVMRDVKSSPRLQGIRGRLGRGLLIPARLPKHVIPPSVIDILRLIRTGRAAMVNDRIVIWVEVEVALGLASLRNTLRMEIAAHVEHFPGIGFVMV